MIGAVPGLARRVGTRAHSVDEFRDTTSTAHHEVVEIVQRLARRQQLKV
jgi:hypothetical protein